MDRSRVALRRDARSEQHRDDQRDNSPTTATIATTSGENYIQLAAAINAVTPSLGVTATETPMGAATNPCDHQQQRHNSLHHQRAQRDDSTFAFTQATAGANASLTVDGVPISSASNTVTGAISGVTLTLLGAAPAVPEI